MLHAERRARDGSRRRPRARSPRAAGTRARPPTRPSSKPSTYSMMMTGGRRVRAHLEDLHDARIGEERERSRFAQERREPGAATPRRIVADDLGGDDAIEPQILAACRPRPCRRRRAARSSGSPRSPAAARRRVERRRARDRGPGRRSRRRGRAVVERAGDLEVLLDERRERDRPDPAARPSGRGEIGQLAVLHVVVDRRRSSSASRSGLTFTTRAPSAQRQRRHRARERHPARVLALAEPRPRSPGNVSSSSLRSTMISRCASGSASSARSSRRTASLTSTRLSACRTGAGTSAASSIGVRFARRRGAAGDGSRRRSRISFSAMRAIQLMHGVGMRHLVEPLERLGTAPSGGCRATRPPRAAAARAAAG